MLLKTCDIFSSMKPFFPATLEESTPPTAVPFDSPEGACEGCGSGLGSLCRNVFVLTLKWSGVCLASRFSRSSKRRDPGLMYTAYWWLEGTACASGNETSGQLHKTMDKKVYNY